jgi:hypothetical protein
MLGVANKPILLSVIMLNVVMPGRGAIESSNMDCQVIECTKSIYTALISAEG